MNIKTSQFIYMCWRHQITADSQSLSLSVGGVWSSLVCWLRRWLCDIMGCFPPPSIQLSEGTHWAGYVSGCWRLQAKGRFRVFRQHPPLLDNRWPAKPSGLPSHNHMYILTHIAYFYLVCLQNTGVKLLQ